MHVTAVTLFRFRADSLLLSLGDEDAADKVRRKQLAIEASDM